MVVRKNVLFQKLFSQTDQLPVVLPNFYQAVCRNNELRCNNLMINLLKKFLNRWLFETIQLAKQNEFKRLYRMATIVMASFMTVFFKCSTFLDFEFTPRGGTIVDIKVFLLSTIIAIPTV